VGARVVRRDGPTLCERLEVLRILPDLENRPAFLRVAFAIKKVQAGKFRVVVVEQPDTDERDDERLRGDLRDSRECLAQVGRTGARDLNQRRLILECLKIGHPKTPWAIVSRVARFVEISARS